MKKVLSIILSLTLLLSFVPTLSQAESYEDNLILYYSFDNGGVADVGQEVQSFNVSFSSTDSVSGSSVYMDGNSSYLQLTSDLNESLSEDFTISTWVKFESLNYWMRVFDFGANDKSYAFLGLSAPNDLRYALLSDKTAAELNMTAAGVVSEDTWAHYTLVRKEETMYLYVNGVLVQQSKAFGDNSPSDIVNSLNYIGKSQFSADPYFHGLIDEFKVFDAALSDSEIVKNMLSGIKTDFASYAPLHANIFDGKEVKADLKLISFETDETTLIWSTSDESVISAEGVVNRDEALDKEVTLTATVITGEDTNSFDYTVLVPAVNSVDALITVNANSKGVDINPDMIGLFFEDINYAADGGLYAELVQNRSFEATNAQWDGVPDPIPAYTWTVNSSNHSYVTDGGLNENNPTFLRLINPSALDSFSNACYSGFPAERGEKFDFSVFLRADSEYNGKIMITITEGEKIIGRSFLENVSTDWEKYETVITAVADADNATVKITLLDSAEGTFDIDMVSLFPQNTWMNRKNGLRADLVQMLKDLHPGFLRFPGGCIIEGYNLSNRYSWKDTVGPVEERKENWNRWQLHTGGDGRYGYCQSYGLGYYEYFLLCEDIGAFPLPVVNVGIGCQYQSGDTSSMEELYSIYIQDALDLIEFANGDVDTVWGSVRASMGHPEPFNLEYIGIGNEQWETDRVNFFERYEAFEQAIHEAYPEMKLIATSGPDASGAKYDAAWSFLESHSDNGEEAFAYAVDEHYYRTPDWFYTNLDRYDGFDRNGYKVFPGEYASRNSQSLSENNMNSALSIAAFMTSLEKNADIVALASYAPLFSREGYTQWAPDLIGFNEKAVYGSPDYYVQSMYSNNLGTYTIENKTTNYKNAYTPHGRVGISTWGTTASFYDMSITNNETGEVIELGEPVSTGEGRWSALDNGYLQGTDAAWAPALLFGTEDMENYTFTLKAKKHSGAEGFLIPVLWENEQSYYTCNIGGWNNTYSAIQRTENGNTYEVSVQNTDSYIETEREYEIKVTVEPHKLTCYLDGEVVNFVSFRQNVYSTSSFDEETGDIIIKAVNTTSEPMETMFDISSDYINPTAHVTELSTDDIWKINTTSNPENVSPMAFTTEVCERFSYYLPANSFTVFRIHTKADGEIIQEIEEVKLTVGKNDEAVLPETVTVTYADGGNDILPVIWDNVPDEFTHSAGTVKVQGKVFGTNLYAYANVTITETDKAVMYEPEIYVENDVAFFRVAFSDGALEEFNLTAIAAAYSEDKILTRVETAVLDNENPLASIKLDAFLEENQVKLFIMDDYNYATPYITVK